MNSKPIPKLAMVIMFPFTLTLAVAKAFWVLCTVLAAVAGVLLGQPVRLLMVLVYYLFFYGLQGWNEGRSMVLRGEQAVERARKAERAAKAAKDGE